MSNAARKFRRQNAKKTINVINGKVVLAKPGQWQLSKAKVEKRRRQAVKNTLMEQQRQDILAQATQLTEPELINS